MTSVSSAIQDTKTAERSISLGLVGSVVALLASVFFVFNHFLINQGEWAIRQPADWGHTLVIPFMGLYLAYLNKERLARVQFRTTWIGLVPVALGVGWYMFTWIGPAAIRNHTLQGAGLGLTVGGLVLLFFGWRAIPWLIFPVAYVFLFGVKIGDRLMNMITYKLQDIAAKGAAFLLHVFQYDVRRVGNTLEIWSNGVAHDLNIAEACSGMRMLVAFLALGVFLAFTMLNRNWQRAALIALAVPVAIFVNVLRVVTLGLLSLINPDMATGDFHTFIGLIWLVPAFMIYLGIMWVLRRIVIEDDSVESARRDTNASSGAKPFAFDHRAKFAVMVACVLLVVSGFGFRTVVSQLKIFLNKEAVPLQRPFATIPSRLDDWRKVGQDVVLSEAIIEELGTEDYLYRAYANPTAPNDAILVHVAYYTDQIDAVPHVPERCFVAQGQSVERMEHFPLEVDRSMWLDDSGPENRRGGTYQYVIGIDQYTRKKYEVRMPLGNIELRTFLFDSSNGGGGGEQTVAGYFFLANGWATSSATEIRKLAFDQTDKYAYYCKVEFSMPAGSDADMEAFVDLVEDFLKPFLPELMRCLPDWADVEAGRYPVDEAENAQ